MSSDKHHSSKHHAGKHRSEKGLEMSRGVPSTSLPGDDVATGSAGVGMGVGSDPGPSDPSTAQDVSVAGAAGGSAGGATAARPSDVPRLRLRSWRSNGTSICGLRPSTTTTAGGPSASGRKQGAGRRPIWSSCWSIR